MAGAPAYRSRDTVSVNSSRTHTEIPILIASHFQPLTPKGLAIHLSSARISSMVESTRLFTTTQPNTINAEIVRNSPVPLGRLIFAKLKRLLSAPPVNTHPYALPPLRMPTRP